MKRLLILSISLVITMGFNLKAQKTNIDDEAMLRAIKIKELNLAKERLQKEIHTEDLKRNRVDDGFPHDVIEVLNDRQDSICLDLRSQLLSINLELRELSQDTMKKGIIDTFESLNQKPNLKNNR